MNNSILIVDDNIKLSQSLTQNFEPLGYKCFISTNSSEALDILSVNPIKVVLLDIVLGEEDGMDVLGKIISFNTSIYVIMITGFGTIETAVQSIKCGAFDYVQKPLDFNKLLKIIENAFRISSLQEENQSLKKQIFELSPKMITQNKKMIEVCNTARRLANTNIPILICGENGTGKELLADFIHKNSSRSSYPMMKINCAAFPENLLDNELFGHEKGAFTGANSHFTGVFEKANKSTLLLDEIGDMSLATQAKILRTLQNQEIKRIGGNETIKVDVRFIAATNKELKKLINERLFREDLYYRLNAASISIPPLRERKEDINLLAYGFLKEFSNNNKKNVDKINNEVLDLFMEYQWPGNIRELKNVINYAAALSVNNQIDAEDLPVSFKAAEISEENEDLLETNEKKLIMKILQKTNFNKKKAAEILNISRKTLYNKLEKYEITDTE